MRYILSVTFALVAMAGISRRQFLHKTISGATMLASGNLAALAQGDSAGDNETVKNIINSDAANKDFSLPLDKLHLHGRIITPKDNDYDAAREDYNGRISTHPKALIYCESEHDVCESIKWARENKIPVVPRGGGHSYEGFSIIDDGAVIDVSKMTKISVNTVKRTATVQSGVRLMQLYETLWDKRMVVPAGSCATVGIAGSTLGGGFGLLARNMGLTCDNLIGVRMVDATGKVIEANEHTNPDLLWACRGGGGGNFGVVTEFTFKLHPIENVTVFRIKWNWTDMAQVIHTWQKWAPHADNRITSVLTMTSKKVNRVSTVGVFLGGQNEVRKLIQPLIDGVKPLSISVSTTSFMDAVRRFSGIPKQNPANGKPAPPPPPEMVHMHIHPRFKNTSDYVEKELNDDAIRLIVQHLTDSPRDSSCLQFDSYGGKINSIPIKDSAFCHRGETKFCMHYQINWSKAAEDERNIKWVSEFKKAMQPHVSGYAYVNYCDRDIENWGHSYYGENFERLIKIKQKYDPDNFFSFAQSIPTTR